MYNNKVLQLCGQITGLEPSEAWNNFNNVESLIKARYPKAIVINPLRLCDHITEAYSASDVEPPWLHYMDICKASLKSIDYLVIMNNAHLSKGAKEEMKEIFILGKELRTLEEVLNA